VAATSAAVLAVLIAVPLVNRFGAIGGGLTYLLAQTTMCCVAWGLSVRKTPMPWGNPLLAARVVFRGAR
jgi:O-antigen/teichoic acid export membrane protein